MDASCSFNWPYVGGAVSRRDLDLWEKEGARVEKYSRVIIYEVARRDFLARVELGDTTGSSETGSRKLRIESRLWRVQCSRVVS